MRKEIKDMTDREIAEETLALMRAFEEVFHMFSKSPMAKMIPGGIPQVNGKR